MNRSINRLGAAAAELVNLGLEVPRSDGESVDFLKVQRAVKAAGLGGSSWFVLIGLAGSFAGPSVISRSFRSKIEAPIYLANFIQKNFHKILSR
jgi:hypothetical protein